MYISHESNQDLIHLHEDMASYFTDEHFPLSGETYWTCVLCLAEAKLAELKGKVMADVKI